MFCVSLFISLYLIVVESFQIKCGFLMFCYSNSFRNFSVTAQQMLLSINYAIIYYCCYCENTHRPIFHILLKYIAYHKMAYT